MHRILLFELVTCLFLVSPVLANGDREGSAGLLLDAIDALCSRPDLTGLDAQAAVAGSWLLDEMRVPDDATPAVVTVKLVLSGLDELHLERRQHNGQLRQFRASFLLGGGDAPKPHMQAIADGSCTVRSGRALRREGISWLFLDQLEGDLVTLKWTETLQAPWPIGTDPGGVRVGLVDSGLAYDLPVFQGRLARDADGQPLGYDFWDLDPWPYDGDFSRGPFLPIRHGTAVASILAREAPDAALVPYRYPRPDMARLSDVVAKAAAAGVRVLAMPLGSRDRNDWTAFEAALEQHDILVVVSAGNDGRDIDVAPVYPAALPSQQIITVTSADEFGRLAEGSNWGETHVDIMVPAENLPVIDFRGATGQASGSSYAVPRVAALAARLLEREPGLSAIELKSRILSRALHSPFEREGVLSTGWLPNPLED